AEVTTGTSGMPGCQPSFGACQSNRGRTDETKVSEGVTVEERFPDSAPGKGTCPAQKIPWSMQTSAQVLRHHSRTFPATGDNPKHSQRSPRSSTATPGSR